MSNSNKIIHIDEDGNILEKDSSVNLPQKAENNTSIFKNITIPKETPPPPSERDMQEIRSQSFTDKKRNRWRR